MSAGFVGVCVEGVGIAFQATETAWVKLQRCKRIHTSFPFPIKEPYLNSILLKHVEWGNDDK